MLIERKEMSMWSSVITTHRAKQLGEIIQKIERVSRDPRNRQVGNVVGDLRNLHEFSLIDELKEAVEGYNERVREDNKVVVRRRDIQRAIKDFASTPARRAFVRDEVDIEDIEFWLEEARRGMGYYPGSIFQWVKGELGREMARRS